MRIIVFAVTLFLGIYTVSFFKPAATPMPCNSSDTYERDFRNVDTRTIKSVPSYNATFDASKNYTKGEAAELIGKQVRNLSHNNNKCPKESGNCLELFHSESGKVVGIIPSMNDTFMLEILWKSNQENSNISYVSYVGKELSFEIVK